MLPPRVVSETIPIARIQQSMTYSREPLGIFRFARC
jgi:hypothetical protein